jgi:hypothetical protein
LTGARSNSRATLPCCAAARAARHTPFVPGGKHILQVLSRGETVVVPAASLATRAIGRDVSITIFTASSLNSGEKLFFGPGKKFTFPDSPS